MGCPTDRIATRLGNIFKVQNPLRQMSRRVQGGYRPWTLAPCHGHFGRTECHSTKETIEYTIRKQFTNL